MAACSDFKAIIGGNPWRTWTGPGVKPLGKQQDSPPPMPNQKSMTLSEQSALEQSTLEPSPMPPTDVSRFFTNSDSSVYALKNLPEEVVAYLFARYSRSRLSLREDLRNMIDAEEMGALIGSGTSGDPGDAFAQIQNRARTFAEKYVLGYGHSSVAEHGCVHLALEDVSIIASKLIEDARLASYTEKSTRYVAFDPSKIYYPPAIMAVPELAAEYRGTIQALLGDYVNWNEDFVAQIQRRTPRGEKQSERAYEAAGRATAFDLLRYLLPAATHTNVGLTLNARTLEHLITKLLSQPLAEGRELGRRIKEEAQHIVPTLLKYAEPNAYRAETSEAITALAREVLEEGGEERTGRGSVSLIFSDPNADTILVAAILYGSSQLPMEALLARVEAMAPETQERVIDEYLRRRGKHDAPGRALERLTCTVEMTMDYGAYRDIQRHRMATQTTQALTPALGYEMPDDYRIFGYAPQYEEVMARAKETYIKLQEAGFVHEAAYVLPLATRIRVLFTWNLREVTHFVELRSARQGHPSYRKIAQDVYHAVAARYPLIARYMRPNLNTYALTRE
jgi:thymidylate synthase ThyX